MYGQIEKVFIWQRAMQGISLVFYCGFQVSRGKLLLGKGPTITLPLTSAVGWCPSAAEVFFSTPPMLPLI
jgi:hypothetical protein